jgi:hypothetical protein
MSIDLRNESTLSLAAAARMLPPGRRGRPVSLSCILRWVLDGVRLSSGQVVRLEAVRLGGRWITSVEALGRFADRQTPCLEDSRLGPPRSPSKRERASNRATKELNKIGI